MPLRDVEDSVTEAVWSVLHQSLRDLELVLVDAGSSDATLDVVGQVRDPRVRILSATDLTPDDARDHGATAARGTYLLFADGDGITPEHGCATLVEQAERSGADLVVGDVVRLAPQRLTTQDEAPGGPNTPGVGAAGRYGRALTAVRIADRPEYLRDLVPAARLFRRAAWQEAGLAFGPAGRCPVTESLLTLPFDVVPVPVHIERAAIGTAPGSPEEIEAYAEDVLARHQELLRRAGSGEAPRSGDAARPGDAPRPAAGREALVASWFAGILGADAWGHVARLLDADPAAADAAYARARSLLTELLRRVPEETWRGLPQERRLVLRHVARGRWARAARTRARLRAPRRPRSAARRLAAKVVRRARALARRVVRRNG